MIEDLKSNDPSVLYAASAILLAALAPEPEPSDKVREIVRRGVARVKMQGWEHHRKSVLQILRDKPNTEMIAELNKAAHEIRQARQELGIVEPGKSSYVRKPVVVTGHTPSVHFDADEAAASLEDDMGF